MKSTSEHVLMLGFSNNPNKMSYMAARYLYNKGYKLFAPNVLTKNLSGTIVNDASEIEPNATAVTIFIKPEKQKAYYSYILALKPKRIIFNPGTENQELAEIAMRNNIQVVTGCTIALLSNGLL